MAGNVAKRPNGKWRARYRDDADKEHARHFDRKVDAQRWLDGYRGNRDSMVRQAETHIKRIKVAFGSMPIGSVRPSHVRT